MSRMDFVAKRRLTNGHLMTLYAWGRPRRFPRLPEPDIRYFDVEPPDDGPARVLAHCFWQIEHRSAPALVGLHGLEGSSSAHYMRGLADKAWAAGFSVILLNQRNCGGTEHLSAGLYHSGLTNDPRRVVEELIALDRLSAIVVAGYSLGGNLALKLAGEYGDTPPPALKGVAAISPVVELEACVRALERRENVLYQWNFVRNLKARMRRKARAWPGRFDSGRLGGVRTVRAFDDAYTAPFWGFRDAEDYYHRASALRVAARIGIPALVVTAEDDPFVPTAPFRDPALAANPHVRVIVTRHGGHCAFVGDPANPDDDGYWAERAIVGFAKEVVTTTPPSAASRTPALSPALRV